MGHTDFSSSQAPAAIDLEAGHREPRRAHLSVVMPAFNEAQSIAATIAELTRFLAPRVASHEILVVDDGSTDATAAAVVALPSAWPVVLLQLSRNFGKEAAITAGLEHAQGDVVLCIDADGQHPLATADQMLRLWQQGHDMVYAVRQDRGNDSPFKRWGARWFYRALGIGGQVLIPPDAGDFRVLDRRVVDAIRAMPEHNRFMKGLYAWVGFRTVGVPYIPAPRGNGASHYSRAKLLRLAWSGITGFSSLPLRAASVVGLGLALLASGYLLDATGIDMEGKEAVIVGHSELVGKPVSLMLLDRLATVTICHIATAKRGLLAEHVRRAEILVVAVGSPEVIRGEWVRPGAVVIDVGINQVGTRVVGDVEFAPAQERAAFMTPVPGGVGPMTIAALMKNTLESATRRLAAG